ncbi:MAG: adenosylmethionine decarboxylase [Planctomycetota bacterium]
MTQEPTKYCGSNGVVRYAGIHLIIEVWQARYLTDARMIETIMREAVAACGATLLRIDLHEFSPNGGISGVGILQESHISVHTWPEYDYAAMDIFVCGTLNPYGAVEVLKRGFQPGKIQIMEIKRGILE